jgi:hypothetical protein
MSKRSFWAVEFFQDGHWRIVAGGLSQSVALRQAKIYAKSSVERVSIAEYGLDEGSSAVSRKAVA